VRVDCGRGGDLARVLRSLRDELPGPVVVHVAGTCSGPIEITRDGLTLRADDPESAAIEGSGEGSASPVSPIVTVRGVRNVRLENLRISDGRVGLGAFDAEVTVQGCDVARTDVAVQADGATVALARTTLREARNGIAARRSRVAVSFGTIRDVSDEGILATELSQLTLFRAEVSSDGVSVESHSAMSAVHCALEGSIHVRAYSQVSLAGASGPTATLRGDIYASNSEVVLFRLPVEGTVRVRDAGRLTVFEADLGEVRLDGRSHARVTSAHIAGDLLAEDFSTVRLSSTSVTGVLACRSGADAVCEQSETGSVSACPRCAP
jgi:hypothetical protein